MIDLLKDLLPHAPKMGLYVAPHLPADKVRNAVRDYAKTVAEGDVVALYDATLLGNGKDGAVFTRDRLVFQNTDLEPAQEIRYADIVRVEMKKKFIGGKKVRVDVNRGRATVPFTLDFSGKPAAAEYVTRFLHEAMIEGADAELAARRAPSADPAADPAAETDRAAVTAALDDLRRRGLLADADYERMLKVMG